MRIGQIPPEGRMEDLTAETDAVLVWTGGPSDVHIWFCAPESRDPKEHRFERVSGMIDLLPKGTVLVSVTWTGKPSTCTSVNLPGPSLVALGSGSFTGLSPDRGPEFGLVDAHVVDLVRRLQDQAEGVDYLGAVYVQSLSLALASYVSARFGGSTLPKMSSRPAHLTSEQRSEVERFVERELGGNFGLVDMASLVGYSPDHFSRLFKGSFEQSPHQYVLSRRIEKAKAMLRDEGISIAEIATNCGFSNQAHLTTAFKQRTGITPGAYRRGK
jgi:AraC family transcriptional regulator